MLLQYDGLYTIGDNDEDYMDHEGPEEAQDVNIDNEDPPIDFDQHLDDVADEEVEIEVGYSEKRSRLWTHHMYDLKKGNIRWMKTADECRNNSRANPIGEPCPWNANQIVDFNVIDCCYIHDVSFDAALYHVATLQFSDDYDIDQGQYIRDNLNDL